MKRKKKSSNNATMVIAGGIGAAFLIGIGCFLFFRAGNPQPGLRTQTRNASVYDTMLRNNAFQKRGEIRESGRSDNHAMRQVKWLSKVQNLVGLIPWESTYLSVIPEEAIKANRDLADLRIDLIGRFAGVREKFDQAIGDPTDANISEAVGTLRANKSLVRDAIRDVRAKSGAIGANHADFIEKTLNYLLDSMDDDDYE